MTRFLIGVFSFVALAEGAVALLYFSPLLPFFSKPVMENLSLAAHAAALLCYAGRAIQTKSSFFLWASLWIAALVWRDWHLLEHLVNKTLLSFSHYLLIFGAFASGLFWKKTIVEVLRKNRGVGAAWCGVFLFYFVGFLCDKRILTLFFPGHELKLFENYVEEFSEALGAILLFATAFAIPKFQTEK